MNNLINALKEINFKYMMKSGTITLFTLTLIYNAVGPHYIMIAFPLTLIVTIINRHNFKVKLYSKTFRVTIICMSIVLISFIGGINIYLGIVINMVALFTLMFVTISPYNINFYKPYLMLYVFVQYIIKGPLECILAICTVVIASTTVILLSFLFNINGSKPINRGYKEIFMTLSEVLQCKIEKKDTLIVENKLKGLLYDLSYSVYISRHNKYLGTVLSNNIYSTFILLKEFSYKIQDMNIATYIDLKRVLLYKNKVNLVIKYLENDISINEFKESLCHNEIAEDEDDLLLNICEYIIHMGNIPKHQLNKINKEVERGEYDRFFSMLKLDFKSKAIRYKFSMRMSIAISLSLFLAEFLDFYKIIWGVITILSILQPYYEETLSRTKERVRGNVIGIVASGIILNITSSKIIAILILVLSLYMIFAYKNYYRLSIFTSIASMSISSVVENVNVLIIYRLGYVFVGVLLVMLFNRFVFPYKVSSGVLDLTNKILLFNKMLIIESIKNASEGRNYNKICDLVTQINLYNQKLYIRNQNLMDKNISSFININERFISKIGYYAYKKERANIY